MDGDPIGIARMHERHAHFLQIDNNTLHRELSEKYKEALALRGANAVLKVENAKLKRRIAELTRRRSAAGDECEKALPPFIKANVPVGPRRRPGRSAGHEAALRPRPKQIDVHLDVALPVDRQKYLGCPHCRTQLSEVKHHRRMVEDLVPSQVITTCYHTHSGYCPRCRRRVESRAEDQPPAADLPPAQLGLDALATAAVMRVCCRLPLRQIT